MKSIKGILFAILLFPVFTFAGGTYVPGTVVVDGPYSDGSYQVTAQMNVIYNPAVVVGKVMGFSNVAGLSFIFTRSDTGASFSCSMVPTDPNYARVLSYVLALNSSSKIAVIYKGAKCVDATYYSGSQFQKQY
jgi:hypothetical protein